MHHAKTLILMEFFSLYEGWINFINFFAEYLSGILKQTASIPRLV